MSVDDLVPLNGLNALLLGDEERARLLQEKHKVWFAKPLRERNQLMIDEKYREQPGDVRFRAQLMQAVNRINPKTGEEIARHRPLVIPDIDLWAPDAETAEHRWLKFMNVKLTPPSSVKIRRVDEIDQAEATKPHPRPQPVAGIETFESEAIDDSDRFHQGRGPQV